MTQHQKTCVRCNQQKALSEFAPNKKSKDKLEYRCKSCEVERRKETRHKAAKRWEGKNPLANHLTGKKTCRFCKLEKPIAEFSLQLANKDGLQKDCKACQLKRYRQNTFGISAPKSDQCDICQSKDVLSIDHCHTSGKLRGTLCRACNTGLGLFKDNPNTLASAIAYLTRWRKDAA